MTDDRFLSSANMSRGLRRARGSRTVMKNRCTTDDRLLSSVDARRSVPGFFNSVDGCSSVRRIFNVLIEGDGSSMKPKPATLRILWGITLFLVLIGVAIVVRRALSFISPSP